MLPDEAVDMTVTELHTLVVSRLFAALRLVFGDTAAVLADIFLRVGGDDVVTGRQVSPDLLIVPGARPGKRRVYRVPDEPVPAVTMEILSYANHTGEGREALEAKRELLGSIGVPTHLEIDPERGSMTIWEQRDGVLVVTGPPEDHYDGPALGGLRLGLAPDEVRIWLPDGREFLNFEDESARADAATARADAAAARAERYRELLRRHGIDPDMA